MSKFKKIAMIVGFLLTVVIMGFLIYVIFFKSSGPLANDNSIVDLNTSTNLDPGNTDKILPQTNRLPDSNANKNNAIAAADAQSQLALTKETQVLAMTKNSVNGVSLSQNGNGVYYYDQGSGLFYKINADGKVEPLSDKIFYQVDKIAWSPKKDKAVLEYPDGANIVYDFTSQNQATLPAHWDDFAFSEDGETIISKNKSIDAENNFLIVSDTQGSKTKIIRSLGEKADHFIPMWSPTNQIIAVFAEDYDLERQEIFFIGQNSENFKSMVVEGRGFWGQWSPQGDKIVYSVYSSRSQEKPELWVVDATGDAIGRNRKMINIQTWADKCVFYDNSIIFCAVPDRLDQGAGMAPEEMDNSSDSVYKININTGTKTVVAKPAQSLTMKNLVITDNGKNIYFTNKKDGRLYKMELK